MGVILEFRNHTVDKRLIVDPKLNFVSLSVKLRESYIMLASMVNEIEEIYNFATDVISNTEASLDSITNVLKIAYQIKFKSETLLEGMNSTLKEINSVLNECKEDVTLDDKYEILHNYNVILIHNIAQVKYIKTIFYNGKSIILNNMSRLKEV